MSDKHGHPTSEEEGEFASETGSEYEEEEEETGERTADSHPSTQAPSPLPSGSQAPGRLPGGELSVPPEIKDLFQYIAKYSYVEIDMEPELKPFIPELMPAIGDIDAFIKIPRPDNMQDKLGLVELDEPNVKQSDPHVLELQLRAVLKFDVAPMVAVRTVEANLLARDPKPIDAWIQSIKEVHANKPAPSVHYSRHMPDLESLMQVWPARVEEVLGDGCQLPPVDLDVPLDTYVRLLSVLLDVPLPPKGSKGASNKSQLIESLHLIFRLYSEFTNSDHFKKVQV